MLLILLLLPVVFVCIRFGADLELSMKWWQPAVNGFKSIAFVASLKDKQAGPSELASM